MLTSRHFGAAASRLRSAMQVARSVLDGIISDLDGGMRLPSRITVALVGVIVLLQPTVVDWQIAVAVAMVLHAASQPLGGVRE